MNRRIAVWPLLLLFLAFCPLDCAPGKAQSQSAQASAAPSSAPTMEKNVEEYIELLHTDIRQQKAQIIGAVMALDVDQAATFWPIYSEYDVELTKLNKQTFANIQEYARNYDQMTDAKADALIQNGLDYRKQRSELLAKYYGRVKTSLGSIEAARFIEIEDQLLTIIDLQMESALPIAAHGT